MALFLVLLLLVGSANAAEEWCPGGLITQADREVFLNAHNSLRSRIALGTMTANGITVPQAANMQKMKWDCDLEKHAQTWAEASKCSGAHDANRPSDQGENYHASYRTKGPSTTALAAPKAAPDWESEYNTCNITTNIYDEAEQNKCAIGHATQMAWAKSSRLGCGIEVRCDVTADGKYWVVVYCRYSASGNVVDKQSGKGEMYVVGPACSQCPEGSECEQATGLCTEKGSV